jgi:hypothetical protein
MACVLPLEKGTSARPAGSSQIKLHRPPVCEEGGILGWLWSERAPYLFAVREAAYGPDPQFAAMQHDGGSGG